MGFFFARLDSLRDPAEICVHVWEHAQRFPQDEGALLLGETLLIFSVLVFPPVMGERSEGGSSERFFFKECNSAHLSFLPCRLQYAFA